MENYLKKIDDLVDREVAVNNEEIESACHWLLGAEEYNLGARIPSLLIPSSKADEIHKCWENMGHQYVRIPKIEGIYDMIG